MAQELKDTQQPAPPPPGGRDSRRVLLKALALVGEVALQGLHVPPAVCNAVQALTADMPLPATGAIDPEVRAVAVLALGKIATSDSTLARRWAPAFARSCSTHTCPLVRNNAMLVQPPAPPPPNAMLVCCVCQGQTFSLSSSSLIIPPPSPPHPHPGACGAVRAVCQCGRGALAAAGGRLQRQRHARAAAGEGQLVRGLMHCESVTLCASCRRSLLSPACCVLIMPSGGRACEMEVKAWCSVKL